MYQIRDFQQAYSQAPWRKQLQLIGAFLLVLIAVWMIAAMYLDVTMRAAATGREIQEMQVRTRSLSVNSQEPADSDKLSIEELRLINANLETQLASLNSDAVMAGRAVTLDFKPVNADDLLYLQVQGYEPPQTAQLAPPPGLSLPNSAIQRPEPKSMIQWFGDEAQRAVDLLKGVQP